MFLLQACSDEEEIKGFSIAYLEAQTYSNSILRSRSRTMTVSPDNSIRLNPAFNGKTAMFPEKAFRSTRADLGTRPTAGLYLEWELYPTADGYDVYFDDTTNGLQFLTSIPATNSSVYIYITNPSFDRDYRVRVDAKRSGFQPLVSQVKSIRLLGQYTLTLTGPVNYGTITATYPTFTWIADNVPGSTGRLDYFRIRQVNGSFEYSLGAGNALRDMTSWWYNYVPLQRNTLYEWDIYRSITYRLNDSSGSSISVSFPRAMNAEGEAGSNNGRWYFTVSE